MICGHLSERRPTVKRPPFFHFSIGRAGTSVWCWEAGQQGTTPRHHQDLSMADKKKSKKERQRELRMLDKEISGGRSLIDYGKINQVRQNSLNRTATQGLYLRT